MRTFRPLLWGACVLACVGIAAGPNGAYAVPPGAVVGSALPKARWVKHRVIPGERLREIGERYAVSVRSLIRWNDLNPKKPMLRIGSRLRVRTRLSVPPRERIKHRVRPGDSWARIARKYGVKAHHLRRRWNPRHGTLKRGQKVIVWVDGELPEPEPAPAEKLGSALAALAKRGEPQEPTREPVGEGAEPPPEVPPAPDLLGSEAAAAGLPIVPIRRTSRSIGHPSGGRIRNPLALPENPVLYTIRSPAHAYGSSHTLYHLQLAIAKWRARTGYGRELVIMDISRKGGGRLRPHRSHRAGRDVDIRLPLAEGVPDGTVPLQADQVDWDAAWDLVHALIETRQVTYIFLTRNRQIRLRKAAIRAGASDAYLAKHIQYPARERINTVRHSKGHTKHIHVRFKCSRDNERCRGY